ncbi:unnamed protein product [Rangifer tarandus platyrhynchus]|uniref:Uncharacterized protein n=2 Tax=Rangifer tarandus platyrhynchus TaxID=3082113 RepID=A0ABN8YGE3_RANTA|nr:unnamed protein product [Rangifer tarandus platyrhynchus]
MSVCVCSSGSAVSNSLRLWTGACQTPLSMGFFYQEYCSGFPLPTPGDLPNPGIEPTYLSSPALPADSLLLSHRGSPNHEKNIRQIQVEETSTKHLTILLKTVKIIKNQENLTNCLEPRGTSGHRMTQCDVVSWMGG